MIQVTEIDMHQELLGLDPGDQSSGPREFSAEQVTAILIKGINSQQLLKVAEGIIRLPAEQVAQELKQEAQLGIEACRNISSQSEDENAGMLAALQSSGIEAHSASDHGDNDALQTHSSTIQINARDLIHAITVARKRGFELWNPKSPAALECVRRIRHSEILIKQDEATIRIEFRWENKSSERATTSRFHPSESDLSSISLPHPLWPLYYLIRPFRVARRKLLGDGDPPASWPYLSTPDSLIPPLLKAARLTSEDLLVDLGCGDGRILIEAARQHGCRGLGIEIDSSLAQFAHKNVTAASLENQVSIKCGDVTQISLREATVVFIFLPIKSIPSLLGTLRDQLPPGARVIAHEQDPIDPSLKPDHSIPIFTSNAITVAHVWIID